MVDKLKADAIDTTETLTVSGITAGNTILHTTGITISNVSINTTSIAVGNSSSNIAVVHNTIRGPSTMYIDPAAVGDNTGLLIIRGDLQVDGNTTTINSTTVTVDDKNIVLASGAVNNAAADGAGITIDTVNANITYNSTSNTFDITRGLNVTGAANVSTTLGVAGALSAGNTTVTGVVNVTSLSSMHAVSALSNTYSYATLEVINTDASATRYFQVFRTTRGANTIGSITGDTSGTGTTYNTTSDYRLKINIQPILDSKERIKKLNPVRHGWIANSDVYVDGFLAHEVQEAGFEYAVTGFKDDSVMQSMDYGRITPVIVAALQEAIKEIEQLKRRIDELESK